MFAHHRRGPWLRTLHPNNRYTDELLATRVLSVGAVLPNAGDYDNGRLLVSVDVERAGVAGFTPIDTLLRTVGSPHARGRLDAGAPRRADGVARILAVDVRAVPDLVVVPDVRRDNFAHCGIDFTLAYANVGVNLGVPHRREQILRRARRRAAVRTHFHPVVGAMVTRHPDHGMLALRCITDQPVQVVAQAAGLTTLGGAAGTYVGFRRDTLQTLGAHSTLEAATLLPDRMCVHEADAGQRLRPHLYKFTGVGVALQVPDAAVI